MSLVEQFEVIWLIKVNCTGLEIFLGSKVELEGSLLSYHFKVKHSTTAMEYYRKYIVDGYLEKPDEAKMDVADDKGPTMEEIDKGSNSINS